MSSSLDLHHTTLPGRRILTVSVDGMLTRYSVISYVCYLLVCDLTNNPLKVVLLVLTREHLVQQLRFPVVTQTTLVVAVTEVSLAVV
jgi:hypothetical protein